MAEQDKPRIKQASFTTLPTFHELEVLGVAKPSFRSGANVEIRKRTPLVITSVSDMEVLIPFFYSKMEGRLSGELKERPPSEFGQTSIVIGEHLHRVDSLLSIVLRGQTGPLVDQVFPTTSIPKKEREAFMVATDEINVSLDCSRDELTTKMTEAVRKFKNIYLESVIGEATQDSFFRNVRSKKFLEKEVISDPEIERAEDLLIKAWVQEAFSDNPMTWEFRKDFIIQREVGIVLIMQELGLEFTGRLDSIVRDPSSDKLVVSQIVDFKTGKGGLGNSLAHEISNRQILMMRMMAEWFTAAWFTGKKSLSGDSTSSYIFANNEGNTAAVRRLNMFAYRRFDRKTGVMTLEPVQMGLELRTGIEKWLKRYSELIQANKGMIRELKKKKTQFDFEKLELIKPRNA